MSDTTPRPDETPGDPTAPAQPADAGVTEARPPAYGAPAYGAPVYDAPVYDTPVYDAPAYGAAVAGPPTMSPTDERTWGMVAHAGTLAATVLSGGTLGFLCALVIYLVHKDHGPFVRHHTANALNIQIFAAICVIVGIIASLTIIGLIVGIPLIVFAFGYAVVMHIVGAVKANNGEWWSPSMTPQFVK